VGKAMFTADPINGVKKEAIAAIIKAAIFIPSSVLFTIFTDM